MADEQQYGIKERLANLLSIRSLVTLVILGLFSYLSIVKVIDGESVKSLATMVISFYFAIQTTKGKE